MWLSERSTKALAGVHPLLVAVIIDAISAHREVWDGKVEITSGLRTLREQKELYARGATKTLASHHLHGLAVDVAIWKGKAVTWHLPDYEFFAQHVFNSAQAMRVPVVWGGHWPTLRDGPHFQLDVALPKNS